MYPTRNDRVIRIISKQLDITAKDIKDNPDKEITLTLKQLYDLCWTEFDDGISYSSERS